LALYSKKRAKLLSSQGNTLKRIKNNQNYSNQDRTAFLCFIAIASHLSEYGIEIYLEIWYFSFSYNQMSNHHTICQAAELLGVTTITLRRWEKEGKIAVAKRLARNLNRIYTDDDIAAIRGWMDKTTDPPKLLHRGPARSVPKTRSLVRP
jgi:hypothetical protein